MGERKTKEHNPSPPLNLLNPINQRREILHAHRLGDVLIDAGVFGVLLGLGVGDARDGGDVHFADLLLALQLADFLCGFEAVHDRHVHVHEHEEVAHGRRFVFLHGFEAVDGAVAREFEFSHEGYKELEGGWLAYIRVGLIVVMLFTG